MPPILLPWPKFIRVACNAITLGLALAATDSSTLFAIPYIVVVIEVVASGSLLLFAAKSFLVVLVVVASDSSVLLAAT